MRTDLDDGWLDGLAFALVHYRGVGELDTVTTLLLYLGEAAHQVDATAKDAIGDLADAVARLVRDSSPHTASALEFRNLETGEIVDPEIFTTTEAGRGSVWAARVLNAAVSGDAVSAKAVVAALVETDAVTAGDLGVPMEALINGAAMVLNEQGHRDHWAALQDWAATGHKPAWTWECHGGTHLGLPMDWQTYTCDGGSYGSPLERDIAAAAHVHTTRHAIAWGLA